LCDGQAVSRITFASLFAVLGILYGAGDGSTTFNLPDFRTSQSFPRGATNDAGRGTTGGSSTHVLTIAEMPSHDHQLIGNNVAGAQTDSCMIRPSNRDLTNGLSENRGGGGAHENQPPFQDVNYIIHV